MAATGARAGVLDSGSAAGPGLSWCPLQRGLPACAHLLCHNGGMHPSACRHARRHGREPCDASGAGALGNP